MNAEEPNDDYDAQAAEAAREAKIEELNAVMPQFEMNAKDEGQQWASWKEERKTLYEWHDADLRKIYALQQQLADLQAERDRYREALERIADREGMPWPQYRKKWNLIPWWDGTDSLSGAQIARDALTSPSAIAQEERSCRSKECVLPEGHSGLHRNASGYVCP